MNAELDRKLIAANILRYRTQKGWSKKRASREADVSYRTYLNVESLETDFQLETVRKIAQGLGVRLVDLLRPTSQLKQVRFRADNSLRKRPEILARVGLRLERYNKLAEMLDETCPSVIESLEIADRPNSQDEARRRAEDAAREVRAAFELRENEPIRDICGLLEANGIRVYPYDSSTDAFFGLAVAPSEGGPAVVVNVFEQISVERWIFTAAHELGHLVLHADSFDVDETCEQADQEADANWFAAAFLMPLSLFRREWEQTCGLEFVDRVFKLKRMFRVSYLTILKRLDREFDYHAEDRFHRAFARKFDRSLREDRTVEPDPLSPNAFAESYKSAEPEGLSAHDFVEDGYIRLVRQALDRELISLSKAAEMLETSLTEMRHLASQWRSNTDCR